MARTFPTHRPPAAFGLLAALGVALIVLPIASLVSRVPWRRFGAIVTSDPALTALRLSILVSIGAVAVAVVLGVPLAWVLVRADLRGRSLLRALVVLPLVLPPVVAGIALLTAFGREGLVGSWMYRELGIQLTFTPWAAVLAAAFVAFPFLVLAVEAGLRSLDPRLEQAAAAAGGSDWYVLRRVTLPLLAPQIVAGAVLAWARALGEFGATLMFAGNLQGRTQTLPLAVFQLSQTDPAGAITLSLALVAISLGVIVALRKRFLSP